MIVFVFSQSQNIDFLPLLNYILYYPISVAVLYLNCYSDARRETTKYPIPKVRKYFSAYRRILFKIKWNYSYVYFGPLI